MSHYKRNADANRDALFGPPGGGSGGGGKRSGGGGGGGSAGSRKPSSSSSSSSSAASAPAPPPRPAPPPPPPSSSRPAPSTRRRIATSGRASAMSILSGTAKVAKMKEAEEYRAKAKKAMSRSLFSGSDPLAAATYYRRAAEAYKACGENRLERLHRIATGDCQMGEGSFASAAAEYIRAAELSELSEEETDARKRAEVSKLYADAAKAWREAGEVGKAAECTLKSARGLLIGMQDGAGGDGGLVFMERKALTAMEEAVEAHVPDVLNRYSGHRQTGTSAYATDGGALPKDDAASRQLAMDHLVRAPYAHEVLWNAAYELVDYGEYASALYAVGAAAVILECDESVTISLSRCYCMETVLTLALGDVVAADRHFLSVHLQRTLYLSARECKLAEDLIRAVKAMDVEALEEARSPRGSNRAALAALDASLRDLVPRIRTTGMAKRGGTPEETAAAAAPAVSRAAPASTAPTPPAAATYAPPAPAAAAPPAQGDDDADFLQASLDANFAEMEELMDGMGLDGDDDNDDDDDNAGGGHAPAVQEEEIDDDDLDLR